MKHLVRWIFVGLFYSVCVLPAMLIAAIAALVYWHVGYFYIVHKTEEAIKDYFDIE